MLKLKPLHPFKVVQGNHNRPLNVVKFKNDFSWSIFELLFLTFCSKALQAPACHENMVKVGGYILGEFGNLIAGDQRSSPLVQVKVNQLCFD